MKVTLLLLWSLVNTPLQNVSCSCQGGAGGAVSALNGSNSGFSDGYGAYGADGYGDFSSPVRNCRGRGGKCCCKDSTCNMYQHYPYQPDNHGYYYFRPYNYGHVWKHQQWVTTIGGDPRNPYSRAVFIPVYEQFENTAYEADRKPSNTLSPLPNVMNQLPDLQKLMKGQTPEAAPDMAPTEAPPPTPAPPESENK